MTKSEEQQPLSLQKALQQCELVQNMIDLSISNLEGLRTKCATSNDLTQKEIRTLEVGVAYGQKAILLSLPSPPPLHQPLLLGFCLSGAGGRGMGHQVGAIGALRWMSLYCAAVVCIWLGGGSSSRNCYSLFIITGAAVTMIIRFLLKEGVLSFFRWWICLYATGLCA